MGKRGKKTRGDAAGGADGWRGSAAAIGAFLSRPIIKELTVRAIVAAVTATTRSEAVRSLGRRARPGSRQEPAGSSASSKKEERRT